MAERKQHWISLGLTVLLVGLNLVALNYLLAGWATARVDLTEDRLFSISPATERILGSLDEDLTILGYFSKRTHPKLAPLVPEIEDLLQEYAAVSRGRVHVEIVDPGENDAAEQEAADRFGVRSTPFRLASKYENAIVNAYFALVVRYGDQYVRYGFEELIDVEPTPDGDVEVRLRNPEYDLTRAIKKVVYGFRSTHDLFDRLDRPVRLVAVWTPDALPELLSEVPEAVRKAAQELSEKGGERFEFEEIEPRDEATQQAVHAKYGAEPISLGLFAEGSFYLSAFLEIGEQREPIYLVDQSVTAASIRESVENALRRNTPGFLKTVGIATSEGPEIPPEIRMQLQMPPEEPPEYEEVQQFLRQDYETTDVDLEAGAGVPSEVDVLLVLEPKNLSEQAVYHLDQYLMRGGRIIICSGSYDVSFSGQGLSLTPIDTGLGPWLEHFGITIGKTLVLDDRNQPLPVPQVRQTPFGMLRTWELAPYPYLVQVSDEGLVDRDVTARLQAVGIYWGSPIEVDPAKAGELEVSPLLKSSARSWTSDDLSTVAYVDYQVPEATQPHVLAVAASGRFPSWFADREPPTSGSPGGEAPHELPPVPLERSPDTRLVVIGDSQFLSDFVARALARVEGGFFSENLRFAENLIDWVTLDNDMLAIRSRGGAPRRLERVDEARQWIIEWVNYAVPLVVLLAIGLWLRWRRRQTVPLIAATTRPLSQPTATTGEV